jgi:hypothetical protein
VSVLGDIFLGHYAGASNYADLAVVAAVEELKKHADRHPDLVARVEMAMLVGGNVGIPYGQVQAVQALMRELKETTQ